MPEQEAESSIEGEEWENRGKMNFVDAQNPANPGEIEHLSSVGGKPAWREVLKAIAGKMNERKLSFKVVGGTSAVLHGVRIPVKDIDLEMSRENSYIFQELFNEHNQSPVKMWESTSYRSYFGVFEFDGVIVEVSGNLERYENGRWVPTWCRTSAEFDLDGTKVNASWLEEEVLAYIRRGRLDRAAMCLKKCDREKLVRLIRREVEPGVI